MANQLAYYIRQTEAKEVFVDIQQVIELIGPEKAQELQYFCTNKMETRTTRVGPRSAIPAEKRITQTGLAGFNRVELLEAIEAAQGVGFQAVDANQPVGLSGYGTPNPMKTPAAHVKKLQDRGLLPS